MIIAIGGISNSGKSKLAKQLFDFYKSKSIIVLCQDDFVFPEDQIPQIYGHIDWETPLSIDFKKFNQAIRESKSDFEIVIVEGLMVFYNKEINDLFDKKIFIKISKEEFIKRKSIDLRWGREPDWYIHHIWESYLKYGIPSIEKKLLRVDGHQDFQLADILRFINK